MLLRSMRLTGEKARGASLDSNEQVEVLAEFNTFLDSLAIDRLYAFTVQENSTALTSGTSTYTIGTNGVFAVTRPVRLMDPCFIRDSSGYDSPLSILNAEQYGRIVAKASGNTTPEYIYYDAGLSATSTGTIHLYPVPDGKTLFINSWRQLGSVANLSTNLNLPPGYQLFLESNFAIHLATGLTPVSPELAKMARESKAAVMLNNLPEVVAQYDSAIVGTGRSNILTGP